MATNKAIRIGPVALGAVVANIYNTPAISGGVNPPGGSTNTYTILKKIRITNKTAAAHPVSLYIGATGASAAGTEIALNKSVPANDSIEIFGVMRLDAADFLTGNSDAITQLTFEAEGEIGVA
jgi:hypothetical protein